MGHYFLDMYYKALICRYNTDATCITQYTGHDLYALMIKITGPTKRVYSNYVLCAQVVMTNFI